MKVWKGSLSFGLVNIPVELYKAVRPHALGFKLPHAKCKTPIMYRRWCAVCSEDVEWQNVVKGLKIKDKYVLITPEYLKKIRQPQTSTIAISQFSDMSSLDPVYTDTHYYVISQTTPHSPYFLFVAALKKAEKLAIGTIILRDREHVCALRPYDKILLLTILNYQYEIVPIPKIPATIPVATRELEQAARLIKQLSRKTFAVSQFKDTFAQKIKAFIEKGSRTKRLTVTKVSRKDKIPSLIESLKASVWEKKKSK